MARIGLSDPVLKDILMVKLMPLETRVGYSLRKKVGWEYIHRSMSSTSMSSRSLIDTSRLPI